MSCRLHFKMIKPNYEEINKILHHPALQNLQNHIVFLRQLQRTQTLRDEMNTMSHRADIVLDFIES